MGQNRISINPNKGVHFGDLGRTDAAALANQRRASNVDVASVVVTVWM